MPRRNNRTKPIVTRTTPLRTCGDKRSFTSRTSAKRAINERSDIDIQLRCYLCTSCGRWHLTSQNS